MLGRCGILLMGVMFIASQAHAETVDECLTKQLNKADNETPVSAIKQICAERAAKNAESAALPKNIIAKRLILERQAQDNPFVLTPHKLNYAMLISRMNHPNEAPFEASGDSDGNVLDHEEAVFQLSIKVPLSPNGVFIEHDGFYFGYTVKSFWQVFNTDNSSPFRETNYNPEAFYFTPLGLSFLGGDTGAFVGLEHQSNGRADPLSRSWNRIYINFLWASERLAMSFKPWYRVPEDDEDDNNPDIENYMGNFEYKAIYKFDNDYELSGMFRQNFDEERGFGELGFSFPFYKNIRGYVQYSNGYGDSMLDYNHKVERMGIGVMLNDAL